MGIKDRKERQKQEIKRLILDTARKLFLEEGFEKVTLRHLAGKIEYSPATIYLYFKDKDEILFELHQEGFRELIKRKESVAGIRDPLERLRAFAEVYLNFALENPEYYDLMFIMRSPIRCIQNENTVDIGMRSYDMLKRTVQECIDAGLIASAGADVVAFALWSSMHGMISLLVRNRCIMFEETDVPKIIKGVEDYLLGNISIVKAIER
jgi:AcrR family transcriptional regulator